jgi:hypothetical protein
VSYGRREVTLALNATKSKRLEDAGLDQYFDQHRALWDQKARRAHDYAKAFVVESGEEVRQDDVVPLLVPALEVFDDFRDHLAAQKLTQKYWYTYFAELIVDRFWRELTEQKGGA